MTKFVRHHDTQGMSPIQSALLGQMLDTAVAHVAHVSSLARVARRRSRVTGRSEGQPLCAFWRDDVDDEARRLTSRCVERLGWALPGDVHARVAIDVGHFRLCSTQNIERNLPIVPNPDGDRRWRYGLTLKRREP